jgi:hypothetical protein
MTGRKPMMGGIQIRMIGKSFTKAARVSLSSRYSWRRRKRGEEGGEGGEEEEEGDEEAGEEGGEEEVGGMRWGLALRDV